jgi:hypothetical protein
VRSVTQEIFVSALDKITCLCLMLVVCQIPAKSSEKIANRIVCREELSANKREELAARLRSITGWTELKFDANGALRFETALIRGGSATARELFLKAESSRSVIVIEDASNRQDVVFARVIPARWKNHASNMPPTFVLLIDFADFDRLMGDRAALDSFNVGWAFLHELDHVVNDLEDPENLNETGECETHLNLMRRECNLPLRSEYFFTYFPHAQDSEFKTRFVRLAFEQNDPAQMKSRRYWIMWDATLVGGINAEQLSARR